MADWSPWLRLTLAVLATWRLARLVAREDGPFDLVVRIRARVGDGFLGQLMDCPYCLSLWIAAPLAGVAAGAVGSLGMRLLTWLAISGGACALEELLTIPNSAPPSGPPGAAAPDPRVQRRLHALLRRETRGADDRANDGSAHSSN